jgi:hypothetical protein
MFPEGSDATSIASSMVAPPKVFAQYVWPDRNIGKKREMTAMRTLIGSGDNDAMMTRHEECVQGCMKTGI